MNTCMMTLIDQATEAVDISIAKHRDGKKAPLSLTMLTRVQAELREMREQLPSKGFNPTYPRFVMDWPDDDGLVTRLLEVAYIYGKSKG